MFANRISRRGEGSPVVLGTLGFIVVMCLLGLCIASSFVGCDATYSEGFRDGTIQKFSHRGMIFKSWEGELGMVGIKVKAGQNAESNTFEFSVDDSTLVEQIKALEPDEHVRVHYRQVFKNAAMYHSTDYRIVKVERLKDIQKKKQEGK